MIAETRRWVSTPVEELKAGMKIRDIYGKTVEVTGCYPSANNCVFVTFADRIGKHVERWKAALVLI